MSQEAFRYEELARFVTALVDGGTLIGLQPGSRHPEKCWPAETYGRLAADLLGDDKERRIVLVGGGDERDAASAVLKACPAGVRERILDLTGRISLRETLAVLTHLKAFVGNDTAIRHAAVALDVPTLALFGPTSARKWGNAAPPRHQVLVSSTGQMRDIPFDEARDRTLSLLTGGELRRPAVVARAGAPSAVI